MSSWLPPLCEHGIEVLRDDGHRIVCSRCLSYWDGDYGQTHVQYDASYAGSRAHFDAEVGKLKVQTLKEWVRKLGVELRGKTVCEVGFGGGHCLAFMTEQAATAYGIEASSAHIEHAAGLGVPSENLYLFESRPSRLPKPVDLWIFQDSFEHIPAPAEFLAWMNEQSSGAAEVLLVAPEAASLSDRIFGRFWPHRMADHPFHWSRLGVQEFFGKRGYELSASFFPWKRISSGSILSHVALKCGIRPAGFGKLSRIPLILNFGEMGLLFRRGGAR